MPNVDEHTPGNFAWMELATTDQPAAKSFYTSLFGWEPQDLPTGPDDVYTMFSLGGRLTGGALTLSHEERSSGIPPHWQLYIAVQDADHTVRRAEELGARTVHPAFDVMTYGRMAVFQDPTGAFVSVWQAREHKGMGIAGENGAFCWADLQTHDRERAAKFYGSLFGWEFLPGKDKDSEGYLHIRNGEAYIGGLPPARTLPERVPPHWLAYVQVADCDTLTAHAAQMGARILAGPMTVEGSLRFSVIADPQGAVFALFQPQFA